MGRERWEADVVLQVGDVIAFTNEKFTGKWVRWKSHTNIYHVAVVISDTHMLEATRETGDVHTTPLVNILEKKFVHIWHFPLHSKVRALIDTNLIADFVAQQKRAKYSWSAIFKAIFKSHPKSSSKDIFCSKLIVLFYQHVSSHRILGHVDATRILPWNLMEYQLFRGDYNAIKGDAIPFPAALTTFGRSDTEHVDIHSSDQCMFNTIHALSTPP